MQFSNPFDDLKGQFYLLQNGQQQFSLWPQQCALPEGWLVVCEPCSVDDCQQWLDVHWQTLKPSCYASLEAQ